MRLAASVAAKRPPFQEFGTTRVRQFEKVMFRIAQYWRCAGQCGVGTNQLGRAVHGTTHFAVVAVLVFGVALGTLAFDEAVRQKHVLFGVKKLGDDAGLDQPGGFQVAVNLLCQFVVFRSVGGVPVVKTDVKSVQIGLAPGGDVSHELLRRLAHFFGRNHDGRPVRVISADKVHVVVHHALVAHPDVGLDVFHDVADVEVAVGVGQGGGDEKFA